MDEWGTGPFENDAAKGFMSELLQTVGADLLEITLGPIAWAEPTDTVSIPTAQAAIAAAEVVAAAHGALPASITPEMERWSALNGRLMNADIMRLATSAVKRIMSSSELKDHWAAAGDKTWIASVADLLVRLSFGPPPKPKPRRGLSGLLQRMRPNA